MSDIMAVNAQDGSDTLVVVIHAFGTDPSKMRDLEALIQRAYGRSVKIRMPKLSHVTWFSITRATAIVVQTLKAIDEAYNNDERIKRIVLVGHSFGGLVLRRAFLVAAGNPSNFAPEPALAQVTPRPWAHKVERIVLLAAFVRGWRISQRLSWKYWFGFNLAGFVGHVVPRWTPTFFDARLGAPFTVQTRLHWLAYRRRETAGEADKAIHRPILIQLIGTKDDLVSPFDQVDISVDGSGGINEPDRDYFLIEVPQTDHKNILELKCSAAALQRAKIVEKALTSDRPALASFAIDPARLTDEIEAIDHDVENTVFVIHGIRDDGFWTHRVAEHIRRAGTRKGTKYLFRGWTATYGYFAMLPFILPWVRTEKVEWFMDQYVSAFSRFPQSNFHYVGHSNGTYLAAKAFDDYPAFHLQNVLFAGSVVRKNFPWASLVDQGRVNRFQNIVASGDCVVAFLPKSLEYLGFDLGGAGFDGFVDANQRPGRISELKYVRGGHGAGIMEDHWEQIAAFIARGEEVKKQPGTNLYAERRTRWKEVVAETHLFLPLAAALVLLGPLYWLFPAWWLFHVPIPSFDHLPDPWRIIHVMIYFLVVAFVIVRV
jgi:pimeloyl-ACP methyl ester carboxylesterase